MDDPQWFGPTSALAAMAAPNIDAAIESVISVRPKSILFTERETKTSTTSFSEVD